MKKITLLPIISLLFLSMFPLVAISNLATAAELHLALADSTCAAMHEAGSAFSLETGIGLQYTCKSSGQLARGIQAGIIKADFFLSANSKWMYSVVDHGLINQKYVRRFLSNELIVVTRENSTISLQELSDLTSPVVTTIIIGDPSRAPFGRYAKQALKRTGLWDEVRSKIVTKKKISHAITSLKVAEEGTVAILYRSGLADSMRLQVKIPTASTGPIEYYSAPLIASEHNNEMAIFLSFLDSDHFRKIFKNTGFTIIPTPKR